MLSKNANHWMDILDENEEWKAKEVLQGKLRAGNFDPQLFEAYGKLLLNMKDKVDAGKFLFLSGVRKTEYQEAISLFINRYTKKNVQQIYTIFPRVVRKTHYYELPVVVRTELEKLQFDPSKIKVRSIKDSFGDQDNKKSSWMATFVGWAIVGLVIISFLVGFGSIVFWLFKAIWALIG